MTVPRTADFEEAVEALLCPRHYEYLLFSDPLRASHRTEHEGETCWRIGLYGFGNEHPFARMRTTP